MKKSATILSASLLLLFSTGCNINTTWMPDTPDIRFGFNIYDATDTKALLESDDLFTSGTEAMVYGIATDAISGHLSDGTSGSTYLNGGQIIRYGSDIWSFTSGELYQWRPKQNHKFFGWLTKDAKSNIAASTFFGSGFSFSSSTQKLTVPAKTMGVSATNFDFAYSDVITRTAADADYSTVDLSLHHLFASFGLSARNYSANSVTIKSIELHGLRDSKSATLDYSGSAVDVTYTGGSVSNQTLYSDVSGLTLAAAGVTGDFKATVVGTPADSPAYYLVWPQTHDELTYDGTKDGEGKLTPSTSDTVEPYLKISYTQDGDDFTAYVAIPQDSDGWAAGVRYEMELSFRDREFDLGLKAADWDKMEPVIDYNGAIAVTQKLRLSPEFYNNCTLSPDGKTAYFKPGVPIVLEFAIGTPKNATWIVGEKLDWDVFDVYNYPDGARQSDDDIITAEGLIDGNLVKIAIDPPTKDLQKTEFSLKIFFSVRLNNGDIVNIEDDDIFADDCPRTFVYIKQ